MSKIHILLWIWIAGGLNLTAQSFQPDHSASVPVVDAIIEKGKTLLGKPYRYRGSDVPWSIDCSGLVCYMVKDQNLSLPRSSAAMAGYIQKIRLAEVRKGDLLFFKGRNINSSAVGHVSMVIDVCPKGTISMMHSCSRGILIEKYNESQYYTSRFISAGRIPELAADSLLHIVDKLQKKNGIEDSVSSQKIVDKKLEPDTISVIGVGDMMIGTYYPSDKYLPPNGGKDLFTPIQYLLDSADLIFGNLEGVLLSTEGTVKKCSNPAVCYAFKSPDEYVWHYKNAGFDVLSIANNHMGDFGDEGRKNTVKLLDSAEIKYAGLLDYPYITFEKNGIRYGFCAFAPNTGTVDIRNIENAKKIVAHLDSISDIVLVSFHGGAEGAVNRHITRKTEMFLGENRGNPYTFARAVIDAGADIVFGHGPHVPRAIDIYNNRIIAYSLGNFATYARFNLKAQAGIAPIFKVNVTRSGEFISGHLYSVKQEGEGGPIPDSTHAAAKEIKFLTEKDIPEAKLTITENGEVLRK